MNLKAILFFFLVAWQAASAQTVEPGAPDAQGGTLNAAPEALEAATWVVRGRRRPPQPSEQVLSSQESRSIAGATGDPVRAVAALPGSSVANDYLANLFVRGSGYNDNLILLDGFPAAYPFHFGGVESVFTPSSVASLAFLPSGFDARYGDRQGGILELDSKRPQEGLHGEAVLSAILAGLQLSHGQPNDSGAWALSYRRGFFDLVLPQDQNLVAVPRYQDYLAQYRHRLGERGEWLLTAFGSQDAAHAAAPPGASGAGSGDFFWESYFHTAGARLSLPAFGDGTWTSTASASVSKTEVRLGADLQIDQQPYEWYLREELDQVFAQAHQFNAGGEWHQTRDRLKAHFARVPVELGSGFSLAAYPVVDVDALGSKAVLSLWFQDRWHALDSLYASMGVRFDWVDLTREYNFAPRASLEWLPDTTTQVKGVWGDYFQSLDPLETVPGWASQTLRSQDTRLWALSFEKSTYQKQSIKIEAFHKDFYRFIPRIVVDTSGNSYDAESNTKTSFNSVPVGFADGVELLYRMKPDHGFFGWFSYAYCFAERRLDPSRGFYEADFSQPHSFNLVANYSLTSQWEIGLHQRVASGIPYTPVLSRTFDPVLGKWLPVFGATNSERLGWYHRMDLRTQYSIPFQAWTLRAYVELLNAYDQENVTSVTYQDDYSGLRLLKQFPRLVFGGVEAVF